TDYLLDVDEHDAWAAEEGARDGYERWTVHRVPGCGQVHHPAYCPLDEATRARLAHERAAFLAAGAPRSHATGSETVPGIWRNDADEWETWTFGADAQASGDPWERVEVTEAD